MNIKTEIYRTANLLIKEYGEMAAPAALIRADQLFERGDISGRKVWLKIAKVAEEMLCKQPPVGTSIH